MTRFRYAVSYESDTKPVETIRGELDATDADDAAKRGLFRAGNRRAGRWKFSSLQVVVEELGPSADQTANEIEGSSDAAATGPPSHDAVDPVASRSRGRPRARKLHFESADLRGAHDRS